MQSLPNIDAVDQWRASLVGHFASGYASNGIAVFPVHRVMDGLCSCGNVNCTHPGKHPVCKNGFKDATTDVVKLADLFLYRDDYNVGIATGKMSGIFVLDVDNKEATEKTPAISGEDSLHDLQDNYGTLPETLTCKTGRGRHLYFKIPADFIIKNSQGVLGPCLDIKSDGGYVIAPPSVHYSGAVYKWETECESVDAPQWLLELLKPKPKAHKPIMHNYSTGQRSEWSSDEVWRMLGFIDCNILRADWIRVGFALHDGGFSCQMWDDWSRSGHTYVDGECAKCWRGFGKNMDGVTMGTLVQMAEIRGWRPPVYERPVIDTSAVDGLVEKIQGDGIKEIPSFHLDFDPLQIPGLIGDTVRAIVKYALQPQPELALFNTLAFAGAVFGRRYASPINTRTNLYMISIARTAAGKDHSRQYISEIAERAELMKYIGSQYIRSDTSMLCDVQDKPSCLMMIDEIGMYLEAVSNPHAPSHIRNVSSALTRLYTSSGSFYDHGQTADRKIKAIKIQRPNLCIYGTTTEKNYAKALRSEAVESGELNRFLVYKSERVFTGNEPEPPKRDFDSELIGDWAAHAGSDFALADHPPEPIVVEWDDECKALQRYYYRKQMDVINSDSRSSLLWGRYMEIIVKIAMIFAIGRDKQFPRFLPEDFKIASSIVDSCLGYMAFLADECISDSPYEADQQKIITFLKRYKNWVPRNILMTKMRSIERKKREDIIYDLVERGEVEEYIEPERADGSRAGRKSSKYRLKQH